MDYKNINDYELIYRIRESSDEDAVNILVKKYEPIIVSLAHRYFKNVCIQGVDLSDFIQEGRIAVIKALNTYDSSQEALFYTYVTICINRHLITYCRNLKAQKHAPLNYCLSVDCLYDVGDISFNPESYISKNDFHRNLWSEIEELDFIDSNIFELRYNGFSCKEIGKLLDVSLSVVSRRMSKIRRTLQGKKDKF